MQMSILNIEIINKKHKLTYRKVNRTEKIFQHITFIMCVCVDNDNI